MITYQREMLCTMAAEMEALLHLHYEELTLNKDRIKLAPLWERYALLERAGAFVMCTARDGEALIGYGAFFVNEHIHYAATKVAVNDVLFLHPGHRKGLTGIRLIKFCEAEMKALAVDKITWHAKHNTPLIPILERLGYRNEEVVLAKLF